MNSAVSICSDSFCLSTLMVVYNSYILSSISFCFCLFYFTFLSFSRLDLVLVSMQESHRNRAGREIEIKIYWLNFLYWLNYKKSLIAPVCQCANFPQTTAPLHYIKLHPNTFQPNNTPKPKPNTQYLHPIDRGP